MASSHPPLADADVTYEEFSDLEAEFTDVDKEISMPIYSRLPIETFQD
jgi:hypothetical protein